MEYTNDRGMVTPFLCLYGCRQQKRKPPVSSFLTAGAGAAAKQRLASLCGGAADFVLCTLGIARAYACLFPTEDGKHVETSTMEGMRLPQRGCFRQRELACLEAAQQFEGVVLSPLNVRHRHQWFPMSMPISYRNFY